MVATSVKVRVEEDGGIHISREVLREIGAAPRQEIEVTLKLPEVKRPRIPVKLTEKDRAKFDLALQLLQESMKGTNFAEAWKFIREGRRDRWF